MTQIILADFIQNELPHLDTIKRKSEDLGPKKGLLRGSSVSDYSLVDVEFTKSFMLAEYDKRQIHHQRVDQLLSIFQLIPVNFRAGDDEIARYRDRA